MGRTNKVRTLARKHTEIAVQALAEIIQMKEASASAKVSAAIALLDRGYGKVKVEQEALPLSKINPVVKVILNQDQTSRLPKDLSGIPDAPIKTENTDIESCDTVGN